MTPAISTILVPTDFSPSSMGALEYARLMAERFGATLHLVHVCEQPVAAAAWTDGYALSMLQMREQIAENAEEQLKALAAAQPVAASTEVLTGTPAHGIIEVAKARGVSLIVMGTHGYGSLNHILLGSVAERVVRGAPCPVLTVGMPAARAVEPPGRTLPLSVG